jgi:membrane-associated phospholipid phosphatase
MAATACAILAISVGGYYFCNLAISPMQAAPVLLMGAALLALAARYRWRGEPKCFNLVMMVFWIVLVTNLHFFPMYMAARSPVPMNDAVLARADRLMGLEVPAIMRQLAPYATLNAFLLVVYQSLIPLMTLAAIVPPLADRMDVAKGFLVGCIVAAAVSLPIFACFQAEGPWHYYGYEPVMESLGGKAAMLAALKTDEPFVIDLANRDGLITFPSFHVVLTVLAAAALWPIGWLRWPAVVWAAGIVVSTVTTGIHYTIDAAGGLVVAAVTLAVVATLARWKRRLRTASAIRQAAAVAPASRL